MQSIYQNIITSVRNQEKLLAVLIDPDKMKLENVSSFINKVNTSIATHIFVGGSIVKGNATQILVSKIKVETKLPVVLFPGNLSQITNNADALLFLSLISGRNPEYLIGQHVASVEQLKSSKLEIIPTGYILIESGKETAVQKVTQTLPLARDNNKLVANTAKAGAFLGMKLIYLEAGSGAKQPITPEMISFVKNELQIPLIVGGGIKTKTQLNNAYKAGADLVVIGTAFEEDESFFNELKQDN